MNLLPETIAEIIRAIGYGPAMEIVKGFGGQEIRIPRSVGCDAWMTLVDVIGARDTEKLCRSMGGQSFYIAMCTRALKGERNRQMVSRYDDLLRNGHSGRSAVAALVREFAPISNRQVETIVNSPVPVQDEFIQGVLF